jgi:hypothetical protein
VLYLPTASYTMGSGSMYVWDPTLRCDGRGPAADSAVGWAQGDGLLPGPAFRAAQKMEQRADESFRNLPA